MNSPDKAEKESFSPAELWLALRMVEGVKPKALKRLSYAFSDPKEMLSTEPSLLAKKGQMPLEVASSVSKMLENLEWKKNLTLAKKYGATLLCPKDLGYPSLLKEVPNRPQVLYALGNTEWEEEALFFSVVGSRTPTGYGERILLRLMEELAFQLPNMVVVSGFARGIDTMAHKAALKLGLRTIAVMACGFGRVYPAENRGLFQEILAKKGAIFSEFHPQQPANPHHFPQRNRIISGISWGTLVVEAKAKSGALITTSLALNQNREVFALPGNIDSQLSEGPNSLIQAGEAKAVLFAKDILEEVGQKYLVKNQPTLFQSPVQSEEKKSPEEILVLQALEKGNLHPDELARETQISLPRLLGILVGLELNQEITQTSDNCYKLA